MSLSSTHTVRVFGTLSLSPDSSALNIPIAMQGLETQDAETRMVISKTETDLMLRLCLAYVRSSSTSTPPESEAGFGIHKDTAIRSRLTPLVEALVVEINSELAKYEKDRGYKIHWEILQNQEFRKRFGQLPLYKDRKFLGGWQEDAKTGLWNAPNTLMSTLQNIAMAHLALSKDRRRAIAFVVLFGRDREAMEGCLDTEFWGETVRKVWVKSEKETAAPMGSPIGLKNAFIATWKKRTTAAGLRRSTVWTVEEGSFVRCLPEWEKAMRGPLTALDDPKRHGDRARDVTLSGPVGEQMIVSRMLSHNMTREEDAPPRYDESMKADG